MTSSTSVTGSSSPVTGKLSRLLLVGGNGMLAKKIAAVAPANYKITAVDLPDFDITDKRQVLSYVEGLSPEIIINCAAYTAVDKAEEDVEIAGLVNASAVGNLVSVAEEYNLKLIHYIFPTGFSTIPLPR